MKYLSGLILGLALLCGQVFAMQPSRSPLSKHPLVEVHINPGIIGQAKNFLFGASDFDFQRPVVMVGSCASGITLCTLGAVLFGHWTICPPQDSQNRDQSLGQAMNDRRFIGAWGAFGVGAFLILFPGLMANISNVFKSRLL